MPRGPRQRIASGYYHVFARGNRRERVFHDDEDRAHFLKRLFAVEGATGTAHVSHCLLTNHFHLLVGPGDPGISVLMQRVLGSYSQWFNRRHRLVGRLLQDRFGSRVIESEQDLLAVVRYIHRNPVAAGMVRRPEAWKWSSHADYLGDRLPGYLEGGGSLLLRLLSGDPVEARRLLRWYVGLKRPVDAGEELSWVSGDDTVPIPVPDGKGPCAEAMEALLETVSAEFGLSVPDLTGRRRDAAAVRARREFCREARMRLGARLEDVACILRRSGSTIAGLSTERDSRSHPGPARGSSSRPRTPNPKPRGLSPPLLTKPRGLSPPLLTSGAWRGRGGRRRGGGGR